MNMDTLYTLLMNLLLVDITVVSVALNSLTWRGGGSGDTPNFYLPDGYFLKKIYYNFDFL